MEISVDVDSNKELTVTFPSCSYYIQTYDEQNNDKSNNIIFNNDLESKNRENFDLLSNISFGSSTVSLNEDIKINFSNWGGRKSNNKFSNENMQMNSKNVDSSYMHKFIVRTSIDGFEEAVASKNSPVQTPNSFHVNESCLQSFFINGSYANGESLDLQSNIDENVCEIANNTEKVLYANDLNVYNMDEIPKIDIGVHYINEEDSKRSNLIEVPIIGNSFLTMENSSNAIDNNIAPNIINSSLSPSRNDNNCNHVFKLPNNELTFNGTLKHLQKLKPIVNAEVNDSYDDNYKSIFIAADKNEAIDINYKISNEISSVSPNFDANSNKSEITVLSIPSVFPSDVDTSNGALPKSSPRCSVIAESVGDSMSSIINQNTSFSDTSSMLRIISEETDNEVDEPTLLMKTSENLDISYNSGIRSPDIFSEDEECEYFHKVKDETPSTDTLLDYYNNCDRIIIKKIEKTLHGVPPPPSVTMCQLTASDILNLYEANLPRFNESVKDDTINVSKENHSSPTLSEISSKKSLNETPSSETSLLNNVMNKTPISKMFINNMDLNCTSAVAASGEWPKSLTCRYYGVHYNSTNHTEDIDALLSRYSSRFVGCETASSCVAAKSAQRSPTKRSIRSNIGKSPGKRLSHLARRRMVYCNANTLQQSSVLRRQILIDGKKYASINLSKTQQLRKSPRLKLTPKQKTPKRKTPRKKTPSSSQKKVSKRLDMDSLPKKESSKRALFLSPDNKQATQKEELCNQPSTSKILKSKRILFDSPNKRVKTASEDSSASGNSREDEFNVEIKCKRIKLDGSPADVDAIRRVRLAKSLSFGGDKIQSSYEDYNSKPFSRCVSDHLLKQNGELTDIHKKKLLWAVAEALRAHGITVKHEQFRLHMSTLARLTRKLSQLPYHVRIFNTPGTSTSETFLKIARQHSFSVIRGKTVEDIFNEESEKLSNTRENKVVGYVPLIRSDSNKLSQSSSFSSVANKNSENLYGSVKNIKTNYLGGMKSVLQDKTINIECNSESKILIPEPKKVVSSKDKLHARRQIIFDTIDGSSNR